MPTTAPQVAPTITQYRKTGLTDIRLIWMRYTAFDTGARPNVNVRMAQAISRLCEFMKSRISDCGALGERGGIFQLSGTKTRPKTVKKHGTVQNAIHWSSFLFTRLGPGTSRSGARVRRPCSWSCQRLPLVALAVDHAEEDDKHHDDVDRKNAQSQRE